MRRAALWCALLLGAAAPLRGQEPCDSLVARAFNEFDASRRLRMLVPALAPRSCPPRHPSWTAGVQLLGETLIEAGRDSLAALWLRWAIRLAPEMKADTLTFTPRLATALEAARDFVARTSSAADALAATTWQWPAPETESRLGRLQISAGSSPDSSHVLLEESGPLAVGQGLALDPGSYGIKAWAEGYDTLRARREVLPGVTTVVEFHLRAVSPVVPSPPAAAVARRKRRFPWKWALVAAGSATTLAVVLAGGRGGGGPATGGIIVTLP